MDWRDIACIVFAATAVNHLGLIAAVERIAKRPLPVVSCPKCLTCWSVFAYGLATGPCPSPQAVARLLAISLLCSYIAVWLELLMYAVDTLYNRIYGTIEDTSKEDRGEGRPEGG
ncbi:MAG: hypothetical protein J6Y33_03500 [Prevotella sp.]|nr:hypothetical protein [Prevotella sp.]